MKKICVIAEEDLSTSRQKRLLDLLYGKFMLTGIGLEAVPYKDIEILSYPHAIKRNAEQEAELERNVAKKDYMKLVKIPNRMIIEKYLQERIFDAIFCKDLVLLPFVIENRKNAKVIMDCREYYPGEQGDERWKRLFAGFNDWLCQTYLPQADYVYSVSQGIAEEYTKNYGIKCDVITSAAYYFAPPPTLFAHSKETEQIKLIYHGMASPERGIEVMIETMDYVDSRFTLDLMLVANYNQEYFNKLQAMVEKRKNVRILPPVSFEEIIPFSAQYDI
ncbi:capsular biosynthesis protein, partial [Helicobacter ganmani]